MPAYSLQVNFNSLRLIQSIICPFVVIGWHYITEGLLHWRNFSDVTWSRGFGVMSVLRPHETCKHFDKRRLQVETRVSWFSKWNTVQTQCSPSVAVIENFLIDLLRQLCLLFSVQLSLLKVLSDCLCCEKGSVLFHWHSMMTTHLLYT